jgi:hypothetical protein
MQAGEVERMQDMAGVTPPRGIEDLDSATIRLPGQADEAEDRVVRPALAVLFRLAVGPRADYYGPRFIAFERAGHGLAAWHWPALFLPAIWAFYRRLWGAGIAFTLLPLAGAVAVAWVAPWLDDATWLWIACAALLVYVLPGVTGASLANALLYRRVRARIERAEARAANPSHAASEVSGVDPVSPFGAAVFGALAVSVWLAAIGPLLTTAYDEHAVRVKVGQTLAALAPIQRQVEESWLTLRHWPRQGIDFPARAGGVLFDEISVDRETGRVKVAVGSSIPEIAGRAILLAPAVDRSDRLRWFCVPVGIPDRFLPQACRSLQR